MSLKDSIADGSAVYGVVGLGYVGLPLAVEMANAGYKVIGFEVSSEKVELVNAGTSYIPDVPQESLAKLVEAGLIEATTDFSRAAECQVHAICVPTPLDHMMQPDVSYMVSATEGIAPYLQPGTLVTLESTTYPGTTEEVLQPIVESGGLKVGENLYLAFSPERVDPGNPVYQTKNTPKVVGGVTEECTEVASAFYGSFLDTVVPVSSTRVAEMTKLLENIFRCVNIALVNELAMLGERMGVSMWEVVDAAKTKPFGFMPFYPGPGLGGHCIPIDPFYLSWKAKEFDFQTQFIELAGTVNRNMPYYTVERIMAAMNEQRKPLADSRVLVLGIAYKSDIDDMRESPAIKVIELLEKAHANVVYHDPYVPTCNDHGFCGSSVELTAEEIKAADAVVILTGHKNVDYDFVVENASLIFDARNVLKGHKGDHIFTL